ncbi:glutamine amidotransferase [Methanoculleus taiwanensis]|uniref:Glutamine amidotransferase n=1 Tax=Methanoculleus taiwanensis TaxID=1550565 RepID=A0A498H0H1_9EURY|nr:gamma-glutamyl-gamma-aminobutyrate hydrolase family protein [Methanoculleus taiwanensis]RXE56118.1 glutamine amidotransferase [Methanoculleus taiwanensis]
MILIVDLSWRKDSLGADEFVRPVVQIVESMHARNTVRHFAEVDDGLLDEADAVILCGTALMDNVFADRTEEFSHLRSYQKPVLGICAGMQIIARLFGGAIVPCSEIGMTEILRSVNDPLFDGYERFSAFELHTFSVEPPESLEVLARSDTCVQAIRHRTLPVYGVMFHPEVRNEWIVTRFLQRYGLAD